ncbi:MAG: hypothetical protein DRJ57_02590 [Thermoprotei archaeon]|nr:MAG: hypothetical protein DRJ57_02590 [Thermoprotei archaeon]
MGIVSRSRIKSPWLFLLNASSCNGCVMEFLAALSPRYDAERMGCVLVGTPRQADVLVIVGPVMRKMLPVVVRTYEQVPEPKAVVAVGSCAVSGGPFVGSYAFEGPLDDVIPVDVYVAGCPPKPEAIIRGIYEAVARKFKRGPGGEGNG